ncbi:MAG TPA: hypothetical protein VN903_31880 [Polyangia bacterium]|nr:hypothetical protein [Polyangia bacterium]HXU05617.1 hypothetical protein [Polyangia bacterium]
MSIPVDAAAARLITTEDRYDASRWVFALDAHAAILEYKADHPDAEYSLRQYADDRFFYVMVLGAGWLRREQD